MEKVWDYVIVGGGASGLSAAVFCARFAGGDKVLLLEKQPRVAKKLLATGNGTCNISNLSAAPAHYHGAPAEFVKSVLNRFTPTDTIAFFDSLGVACIPRENGKVYPRSEQAAAVVDCLRLELDKLGVEVWCDCAVTALQKTKNGFMLHTSQQTVLAKTVFLATGGTAAPALGGSADCYILATACGHTRTPLFPSIVQVKTDTTFIRAMKGLRTDATVTFVQNGKSVAFHTDELLFTEYGISGPAVMQISRVVGDWERKKNDTLQAVIDFCPDIAEQELLSQLKNRLSLDRNAEDFLTGLLNKRIGQTLCRVAGLSLNERVTAAHLPALCTAIKTFTVDVLGTQGFGGAQVTAGGIDTNDICPHTLESRIIPNLYMLGELLNVDGDCGGYNLQWAWASAYVAALSATGGNV